MWPALDCGTTATTTDVQRPKPRTTVVHCASCFLSVSKLQLALSIAKAAYTRSLGTHTLAAVFSVIKCCLIISIDNANRDLSSTPVVPIRNDAQMRLPPFMDASIHPFGQRIVHKVGRRCVVFGFFFCVFLAKTTLGLINLSQTWGATRGRRQLWLWWFIGARSSDLSDTWVH